MKSNCYGMSGGAKYTFGESKSFIVQLFASKDESQPFLFCAFIYITFLPQGTRQVVAAEAAGQQNLPANADLRLVVGRQGQRGIVVADKGQPMKTLEATQRPPIMDAVKPNQIPQSFLHQNSAQASQRVSESPRQGAQQQSTSHHIQGGQPMTQTVPLLSGQRGVSQPASAGVLGSQLPRSPIPHQRPLQPPIAQSSRTQPPTGFMPRVVPLGQPPLYPSPGVHKQPAPGISLQQNQRPAPPAYNSRPAYQSTAYPRLAPKPTAGVNVQVSQVANQVPLISSGLGGRCTNSQLAVRPSMSPQNSMPQSPVTMAPSSLQSSPVASGQQVASSQHDLPGGFGGRIIRPKAAQDVRQAKKDSAKG